MTKFLLWKIVIECSMMINIVVNMRTEQDSIEQLTRSPTKENNLTT